MSLVGEGPMYAPWRTWSRRSMLGTSLVVSVLLAPGLVASTAPPADGADPSPAPAGVSTTTQAESAEPGADPGGDEVGTIASEGIDATPVDPATAVPGSEDPAAEPGVPLVEPDGAVAGSGAAEVGAEDVEAMGHGAAGDPPAGDPPATLLPTSDPSGGNAAGGGPGLAEDAGEAMAPPQSGAPSAAGRQAPGSATEDGEQAVVDGGGLVVDKQVDADGDGTFSDVETARSATAAVAFRVTLTNTTTGPLEILSVVDELGTGTLDLLAEPACAALATTLDPGASTSCTLILDRYLRTWAGQPRSVLTNVVEATATDGEATWAGSDDATVHNANALVVAADVSVTTDADGDGVFTDDEQAPSPGVDVPVRVEVVNSSPGAVVITDLVGTWGDADPEDLLGDQCPALDGMKLWGVGGGDHDGGHDDGHDGGHESDVAHGAADTAEDDDSHAAADHEPGGHEPGGEPGHEPGGEPGHEPGRDRPSSVVCTFTLAGHAPDFGTEVVDVVEVTLAKKHSPQHAASATDSARVWVGPAPAPAVDVELHVGPVGGPLGDHDEAPGVTIEVPPDGAAVAYMATVVNPGTTQLTEIALVSADLAVDDCVVPDVLAPGASFACAIGPVAAEVGGHVVEVSVVATGGDQRVGDADPAHYLGVAVTTPPDPSGHEPEGTGGERSAGPVTSTRRSAQVAGTVTGTGTTATLAVTGAPIAMLAALALGMVLLGLATILVPWGAQPRWTVVGRRRGR